MNQQSDSSGSGCLIVLIACMLLGLCGGGALLLVGAAWIVVPARGLATPPAPPMFSQTTDVDSAEEGYRLAIGPDGELFWENKPIEPADLERTLSELAPPDERQYIRIRILPGLISPDEAVEKVRELTKEYDEVVEPVPPPFVDIAPTREEKPRSPAK